MKTKTDIYYSKILLFGEYSVICDSMGLSIPYTHFKGELSFINEDKYTDLDFAVKSNTSLKKFAGYISELKKEGMLKEDIHIDKFTEDIQRGLYFESTIPQGFGIGSSGALVASVYDKYAINKIYADAEITDDEVNRLKEFFAQLETYFHGVSSGLDPLNSYLKHPLLIKGKGDINKVGIPKTKDDQDGAIFLINTGSHGKTEPLVKFFMDKCKSKPFYKKIREELIPLTEGSIKSMIKGDSEEFFNNLENLSRFFMDNLGQMIPDKFKSVWQKGLETRDYYLKLCGSGGGGFLLGFTRNYEKTKEVLEKMNVEVIPVYRNTLAIK